MRTILTLALVAAATSAYSQTGAPAPPTTTAPSPTPAPKASPKATHKSTTHSVTGTIDSYDAAAHTLTVKMRTKSATFEVGGAKVYAGSKLATADELTNTGSRVTVKYVDKTGGHHVATKITVTTAAAAPKPKASPAATPKPSAAPSPSPKL